MKTILFQGDSITDAARSREDDRFMGNGYPTLVAGWMGVEHPGQYRMVNRGISGSRVVDLYARIKADIINLKPDILSILIGVNDVWHEVSYGNGVDAEKFFRVYSMLVEEVKEALPKAQIMILEPFVLKAQATEAHWDFFSTEVEKRAEKARQAAEMHHAVFVPLQERFDEAAGQTFAEHWLMDGVHPTAAGHEIIKRAWMEGYRSLMDKA